MQRNDGQRSSTDNVVEVGRWKVRELTLNWPKLHLLWHTLTKFRTLFSDLTRGDFDNFVRYVTAEDTFWLEIVNEREIIGIVTLEGMHRVVDLEAHMIFFDRELAEKVPLCRAIVKWVFATFPIQRITVQIPTMYYATVRMVKTIGFVKEGEKRQAVLIGGRWVNVYLMGMTRQEALSI